MALSPAPTTPTTLQPTTSYPGPDQDCAWQLVDEGVLADALAALDAVIQCEPFADVAPPGTEGFAVYDLVAAARDRVARALGRTG